MPRELRLLLVAAALRSFATGMAGVLLGLYLARRGLSLPQIGLVLSAGLGGALLAMGVVSVRADRWGRRTVLSTLATAGALGGTLLAFADAFVVAAAAALLGMVNAAGRDRGAAFVLEQAMLPQFSGEDRRTLAYAVYSLVQSLGHAFGGLAAGLPVLLQTQLGLSELKAMQVAFLVYASLVAGTLPLYLALSPGAEAQAPRKGGKLSAQTRRTLGRISALFAIDSIAGGFLGSALIAYFFFGRFGVSSAAVGALFFAAGLLNAASHLAAAWLARHIGLVNTMVFTHIPSSLILIAVGFAGDFASAAVLFLLREALVEMDVPTRQSYVMAVVQPEERMLASGVTNLVRVGGWAVSPSFAGFLMQSLTLAAPLFLGATLKIGYDLLLYAAFRKLRPPEERQR